VRRSVWRPSRNCRTPAEPRFGQARSPVRGRSEAEWLDRAADRRTISRRDGRGARDLRARQRTRKAIEARWWKKGRRAAINGRRSQNSERVRAHLYERKFRAKPVRECEASVRRQHGRGRIVRRTPQPQETRAVRPDERDIGMGRERPPEGRARGEEGGSQVGVAHALAVSDTGVDTYRDGDTGGIERRPQEMMKSHRFYGLDEAFRFSTVGARSLLRRADWFPTGERSSRVRVPPPRSPRAPSPST